MEETCHIGSTLGSENCMMHGRCVLQMSDLLRSTVFLFLLRSGKLPNAMEEDMPQAVSLLVGMIAGFFPPRGSQQG
jgi:hypothetical protein